MSPIQIDIVDTQQKTTFVALALSFSGPFFFLGMQLSAVLSAVNIVKDKTVGPLSIFPFVSLFTNCVLWSLYGLLKNDTTVLFPNIIGIVSGLFCIVAYQLNCSPSAVPKVYYLFSTLIVIFAVSLYISDNSALIGSIGCVLAVVLMGSPLSTLQTVVASKSTAALPFFTSFMGWCNALSWSAYGLLVANDILIYGPNLLGLALTSFQMILFLIYGK